MNDDISYLLSMACVIPAVTGIYRFKKTGNQYHPFIYMMILVVLLETIIYLGVKFPALGRFSGVSINIYMLLNLGLFLYFVHLNNYLGKKVLQILLAIALLIALFNYIYEGSFIRTFYYLLCFVSAVMLVISIDILSKQIMETKYKLVNNFWFWVSSFSVLYNAVNFLIFGTYIFALFKINNGKSVGSIQHYVNTICYIIFAFAILKIPKKDN
jgi:hypothetical protein